MERSGAADNKGTPSDELTSSISSDDIEKRWQEFKVGYSKSYENSEEEEYRKKIFTETIHNITKHNQLFEKGLVTFSMKINKFADMTPSEVQQKRGLKLPES